jgi:hypothetical protein
MLKKITPKKPAKKIPENPLACGFLKGTLFCQQICSFLHLDGH